MRSSIWLTNKNIFCALQSMCCIINISIYSNFYCIHSLRRLLPKRRYHMSEKSDRKASIKNGISTIPVIFSVHWFSFPTSCAPFCHTFRNVPSALRSQIEFCCFFYISCSLIDMIQMSAPRAVHSVPGIIGKSTISNAFFVAKADGDKG